MGVDTVWREVYFMHHTQLVPICNAAYPCQIMTVYTSTIIIMYQYVSVWVTLCKLLALNCSIEYFMHSSGTKEVKFCTSLLGWQLVMKLLGACSIMSSDSCNWCCTCIMSSDRALVPCVG